MRGDCARCGTVLRRTRIDPLNRALALNAAAAGAVRRAVDCHADEGLDRRHRARSTTLESGPLELVRHGLWPLALVVAFTTAYRAARQVRRHALRADRRCAAASRRPVSAGVFLLRAARWASGRCWRCCCSACSWPTPSSATWCTSRSVPPSMRSACSPSSRCGPTPRSIPMRCGRRSSGAARRTRPCRRRRSLAFHPGAMGLRGLRPGLRAGRAPTARSACAAARRCMRASPTALNRTWALVFAATVLYIPANVYPVLTVIQARRRQPSTILGGVEELLASRMYPLAALVFFASVMVPVFKLLGLAIMLMATHAGRPPSAARRRPAARAHGALSHRRLDRPLVDGRHLHGIAAGRAGAVRRASSPSRPASARVAFCAVVIHHHLRRRDASIRA